MKVLIVTTAFYPEQAIGSVRVSKLVKYLDAAGVEVSVVSKHVSDGLPQDKTLYFDALDRIDWITVDQSPLFQRLFMRARTKFLKGHSALSLMGKSETKTSLKSRINRSLQFAFTLLKGADWARQVVKTIDAPDGAAPFDVVLASYPSYGAPMAARALVRKGVARKMVIDFRDPMVNGAQAVPALGKLNRRLQARFARVSDAALFVSSGVRYMATLDTHFARSYVLTNGFDPDDAADTTAKAINQDKLIFCYTGALYGSKWCLSVFLEALAELIKSGAIPADGVEVHYAGKEFNVLAAQARDLGVESLVVDHGFVKRQESIDLQRGSDVCLVSTWNNEFEQGMLTGKVFEYFLSRKPVVAVVGGNLAGSDMKVMIEQVGAGISIELASADLDGESEALRAFISRCFDEKIASNAVSSSYTDLVDAYGYPRLGVQLRDILSDVVEG